MTGDSGVLYYEGVAVAQITFWVHSFAARKNDGWIQMNVESNPEEYDVVLLQKAKDVSVVAEERDHTMHEGDFKVTRLRVDGNGDKIYGSLSARGVFTEHTKNESN